MGDIWNTGNCETKPNGPSICIESTDEKLWLKQTLVQLYSLRIRVLTIPVRICGWQKNISSRPARANSEEELHRGHEV